MSSKISNPFSTGGGGTTFEHLVGVYYLVSLLAGDIPRGLEGVCRSVKFQTRWTDNILDDVNVISHSSYGVQRLYLQVKHDLTISTADSNEIFKRVIADCWETFDSSSDFDENTDQFGVAVGVYNTKIDTHLQRLLDWARTSSTVDDFERVRVPRFASEEMREYYEIFETVLTEVAGYAVTATRVWKFLKCFIYIYFDVENQGSHDLTYIRNKLLAQVDRDENESRKLYNRLESVVSAHTKTAGVIDFNQLRQQLHDFVLPDYKDYSRDLEQLRNHSKRTLQRTNDTIGQILRLPRNDIVNDVLESVKLFPVVFLRGESGAGKSVLLKKVASHLQKDSEVLVTSIENLSGNSIEEFLSTLKIEHDFQDVLAAFATAPYKCLFVDQLEQLLFDEDRQRVLLDLIQEIQKYNKQATPETSWRIVATCLFSQYYPVLSAIKHVIPIQQVKVIDIPTLDKSDVEAVINVFPSFDYLSRQEHIQDLMRNPFVLDFLSMPSLNLVNLPDTDILTESWLTELYWLQTVRNGEQVSSIKGQPDGRENLVTELALRRLQNGRQHIAKSEVKSNLINALAQDRVINNQNNQISFAHDMLDDWTLSRILLGHINDLPNFIARHNETMQLLKPLALVALRQLELDQNATEWEALLNLLKESKDIAARWYQIVLVAPLSSPLIEKILSTIETSLLDNDGLLLADMIRALRTVHTTPSKAILELIELGKFEESEAEKMLAYAREPLAQYWLPIWKLLIAHQDDLPTLALPEIAEAAYSWMKVETLPLRREVGNLCLGILDSDFEAKLRSKYYDDRYVSISSRTGWIDQQVVARFHDAIFHGADVIPEEVKRVLGRLVDKDNQHLARLLFKDNSSKLSWISIARHIPETFVDITLKLFCDEDEITDLDYTDYLSRRMFRHNGIKNDDVWALPTHYKEDTPFYLFLKMNPNSGVRLITSLVNFATEKWGQITKKLDNITPIPHELVIGDTGYKFWGNDEVYRWLHEVPPKTVTLALLALRYWLEEYIKSRETDAEEVFNIILSQSNSFATIAVCIVVASQEIEKHAHALVPILEQPIFWRLDTQRLVHMMTFGQRENLYDFTRITQYLLRNGKDEDKRRLKTALTSFTNNLPYLYEEEKSDEDITKSLHQKMEEIAILGDFRIVQRDGTTQIEYNVPAHIAERYQENVEQTEFFQRIRTLHSWALTTASGKNAIEIPISDIVATTKELERQFLQEPKDHVAVAEVCSALIIGHYEWLKENKLVEWCKQIVFTAIYHKDSEDNADPLTGSFHIIAQCLPILVAQSPHDVKLRNAVWDLISFSNPIPTDPIVEKIFESIQPLWQIDADYVWQCYNLVVTKYKYVFEHRRRRYDQDADKTDMANISIELTSEIPMLSELDINFSYVLHPLIQAFPKGTEVEYAELPPGMLDFLNEITAFNNKIVQHSQLTLTSRDHQLYQIPRGWGDVVYDVLASWLLNMPFELANQYILDPTINVWEQGAQALERLLDNILSIANSKVYEARLIQIWKYTLPKILNTETVNNNPQGSYNLELKNTYSCLLLGSRYGITDYWEDRDWNPSLALVDEFALWVEKVGHYHEHYTILIRMLKTVGKSMQIPFGVNWLFESFRRAKDPSKLLPDDRYVSRLASLLFDIWHSTKSIRDDEVLFHRITFLTDYLVYRGDPVAVELQRKMQRLH